MFHIRSSFIIPSKKSGYYRFVYESRLSGIDLAFDIFD